MQRKNFISISALLLFGLMFFHTAYSWTSPIQNPPNPSSLITALGTGNIGIGALTPASLLSIKGNLSIGSSFMSLPVLSNSVAVEGNVGVGVTSPVSRLHLGNGGLTIGKTLTTGFWNSLIPLPNQGNAVSVPTGRVVSMGTGSDGLPIITYYASSDSSFYFIHCLTSTCSSFVQPPALDTAANAGNPNAIRIAPDGFPIIGYDCVDVAPCILNQTGIKIVKCRNLDCSVYAQNIIDTFALNPAIVINPSNGLPLVFYYQKSSQNLVAVQCGDSDCTTSLLGTPTVLDTTAVRNASLPTITISATLGYDGNPIIAYYHNCVATQNCSAASPVSGGVGSATNDLRFVRCLNPSCSGAIGIGHLAPITLGPVAGQSGVYNSITAGSDGLPVIAMADGSGNTIIIKCTDQNCSSYTQQPPLAGGTWQSIIIGSNGNPLIAHIQGTNIRLVACYDLACTNYNTVVPIQDVNSSGGISLAISPGGLPIIAYKAQSTGQLSLFSCGSSSCIDYWTRR